MASQVESIKWVPGTRFLVDGFHFASPRCSAYFLTHFHSDHTTGLTRAFDLGPIYCSPVTARLLVHDMGLHPRVVRPLQLNRMVCIEGVAVTPIEANHCPGACMLLFQVPQQGGASSQQQAASNGTSGSAGVHNILHTGDCRWQDWIKEQSILQHVQVHTLLLDTTYALPKHVFPPQADAIAAMVEAMRAELAQQPATLFVVGAYHIGKERCVFGAAHALRLRVWCSPAKLRVLQLLDLPAADLALLTRDPHEAQLHVGAMGLTPDALHKLLQAPGCRWRQVVGFRPTGWSFRRSGGLQCWREGPAALYSVPYSEHSSWAELRACVAALRPRRIVPTVNAATPKRARAIVDRFADLMDLSRDRSRLDCWLTQQQQQQQQPGQQGPEAQQQWGAERSPELGRPRAAGPQQPAAAASGSPEAAPASQPAAAQAAEEAAAAVEAADAAEACGVPCKHVERLAEGSGAAGACLDGVDLQEQRRIWESLQRDRARRELLAGSVAAARQAKQKRRRRSSTRGTAGQQQSQQQEGEGRGDAGVPACAKRRHSSSSSSTSMNAAALTVSAASAASAASCRQHVRQHASVAAGSTRRAASQASISTFFRSQQPACCAALDCAEVVELLDCGEVVE